MPARSSATPKENLAPKMTGTLSCRWDVNTKGQVFLFTSDGAIPVLGYSSVSAFSKFDVKVQGQTMQVREKHACFCDSHEVVK
jgi:hypothetical protein